MGEIVLQTHWGPLVAIYLFFGGLAAGALCVSAIINLKYKDKFIKTVRFGAWAGVFLLIVGVLCLVAETRMPLRSMQVWQSFVNPTSWMTIGAWLLVVGVAIAGLYALASTRAVTDKLKFLKGAARGLAVITIPVSVGIAAYTGILLAVLVAHPLWHTWLLPLLFTVSAVDTGVALILGFATLREKQVGRTAEKPVKATEAATKSVPEAAAGDAAQKLVVAAPPEEAAQKSVVAVAPANDALAKLKGLLEKATIGLVAAEIVVLIAYLTSVTAGGGVGATSVQLLVSGSLSLYFWALFVACGLIVPLAVSIVLTVKHALAAKGSLLPLLGAALCLVGGCALRFLVLLAGLPVYA
jgi:formate-dependent nitrite reductase membrane component NrfD